MAGYKNQNESSGRLSKQHIPHVRNVRITVYCVAKQNEFPLNSGSSSCFGSNATSNPILYKWRKTCSRTNFQTLHVDRERPQPNQQIGRASCRERVCKYV